MRSRISQIVKSIPQVYPFSRVFQMLLDHGLRSKVAKTRQGALDEMAALLKRSGVGACEPNKAFPVIASMISDKDSSVRKSALSTLRCDNNFTCELFLILFHPVRPTCLSGRKSGGWWGFCRRKIKLSSRSDSAEFPPLTFRKLCRRSQRRPQQLHA